MATGFSSGVMEISSNRKKVTVAHPVNVSNTTVHFKMVNFMCVLLTLYIFRFVFL